MTATTLPVVHRLLVLAAALVLPLLPATPAYAVDNVICVDTTGGGTCSQTAATIPDAIAIAGANAVDDTILVGPGTYSDGPYTLDGSVDALTLRGAGQGSTFITLPPSGSQTYVSVGGATVEDLTVTMVSTTSDADYGLSVYGDGAVDGVTVEGTGLSSATGIYAHDATLNDLTVSVAGTYTRAVYSEGGATVTDSTLTGHSGFTSSLYPVAPANPDMLSRLTIDAFYRVSLDKGLINIDNSVVRITAPTGGAGLLAANGNNSNDPMTINADHVTVVGGGPGSVGAAAIATALGAKQTSLITLDDSIVRGQNSSLEVAATNDGAQGGNSDAKIITQYSSFDAEATSTTPGANGTAQIAVGPGVLDDPDPLFVDGDAGDYRLSPTSPLIDAGNPAAGGAATDRDGTTRVVDGDVDSMAVRDLGAYEFHDTTAPDTTLVSGPAGPTTDTTPTYAFTSEPGATFQCKVDAAAYSPCTSPFTTAALSEGAHTFSVQAVDAFANADPTPATRSVTVDTTAPSTRFKEKPAKQVTVDVVKFKFKASEPGSTFQCALDGRKLRTCKPTKNFHIGLGKHKVKVRATDALGNTGRFVKYTFTRVRGCTGEC